MTDPTFITQMSEREVKLQQEKIVLLGDIKRRLDWIIILGTFYAGVLIVMLAKSLSR